jgi:hypothetical protein
MNSAVTTNAALAKPRRIFDRCVRKLRIAIDRFIH